MKKRMRLLAVLLAAVLLTGGCGTSLYEMTDEEENLVVQYAAYALAKYNIYQKDGMTSALLVEEETQQEQTDTQQAKDEVNNTGSTGGSSGANAVQPEEKISLGGAMGQDTGLKVSYKGYSLMDNYQEGRYFSVNANEGKTLLVMEFGMKNTGKETLNLDTVSMDNSFSVSLDGSRWIPEKISFGAGSLSSYDGKIKTGASKKAVLIFEISKSAAESIDNLELAVQMGSKTYSIEL